MQAALFTLAACWLVDRSSALPVELSTFPIFPTGSVPGEVPEVGQEACEAGFANATTCYNVTVPTLVPFLVDSDTAVVIAPGGGFHALSYSQEGTDVAKWLNSLGVSAFVLKYRVPSQFGFPTETPLMDAQRAMRLIRHQAPQLGLNVSRIGFMGFSAGGDLAAGLSADSSEMQYPRIDSVDDQSCRPDFALMVYPAVHDWTAKVSSDHPPAFFTQAENDPFKLTDKTVQYYLTLKNESKAPADLHIFHGDIHAYGLCNVRDADGNIACLATSAWGMPAPAWMPWSDVCMWPSMAQAFLKDLGLVKAVPQIMSM